MKRTTYFFMISFAIPFSGLNARVLDQHQDICAGSGPAYSQQFMAQTFTPSFNAQLHHIDLHIVTAFGVPSVPTTILIVETVNGEPSGAVLGSVSEMLLTAGWYSIDFSSESVALSSDMQYAIVLYSESLVDEMSPLFSADWFGNPYPRGELWINTPNSGWRVYGQDGITGNADMAFRTWMVSERDTFQDPAYWTTFDPGHHGVGNDPNGCVRTVFDGRYIYFAPYWNNHGPHGEFLRYDTTKPFENPASWESFNVAVAIDDKLKGYLGAVFDGRYVYFTPEANWRSADGESWRSHGNILRYDTHRNFAEASSWEAFDTPSLLGNSELVHFADPVFDGNYVYFSAKSIHGSGEARGNMLRYDTNMTFLDSDSWQVYDPGDHGVGTDPDGYYTGLFDGRYVYWAPFHNGTSLSGEILRFDTTLEFMNSASWSTFDTSTQISSNLTGYVGSVFDGRFVYLIQYFNTGNSIVRYDTSKQFQSPDSWGVFDPDNPPDGNPIGIDPSGYFDAVFDGKYIYFAPRRDAPTCNTEMLRYDTTRDFFSSSSWKTFDPLANGIEGVVGSYCGVAFDGQYLYYAPLKDCNGRVFGTILRHAIVGPNATFYVDTTTGNDSCDGLTHASAFKTIGRGIEICQHGDTVALWPGVYEEACDFDGKAITVESAADAAVVRNPFGYAFTFANAEGPDSVLKNLVLAGGKYGIYTGIGCTATIENVTIADNEFGIVCDDNADPAITNCILANNLGDHELCPVPQYSWVSQDMDPNTAPLFADPDNDDYHLLSARGRYWPEHDIWVLDDITSPCVDAGDPTENPSAEGDPNGGRVNMGAFGNTPYASRSPWPLTHDSNRDGRVNLADFAAFASQWLDTLPWTD